MTNENDGIYKGPGEKSNDHGHSESVANIYSNVNVKIKAAAAAAAAAAVAKSQEKVVADDDTTGKDAVSTSVICPADGNSVQRSAVYSLPCFNNNKSSSVAITTSQLSQSVASKMANAGYLNESASSFINKNINVAASGRKMSYGIYQVANQVLIDYDDDHDGVETGQDDGQKHLSPSLDDFTDCSIKSSKSKPTI